MSEPTVFLVGAGPGDPELLTVKALRLINNAQTVVYDRLVSKEILNLVPESASKIYVGKKTGLHTLPQDEINLLLVKLAKNGQSVVRLKGGDPGIFGRGGEEAEVLAEHGVAYELVPGITSAQACASSLGIPLTQRGISRKLTVLSGHCMNNRPLFLNRDDVADRDQTLVIYMGLNNAGEIRGQLLEADRDPDTPVAIIQNGSTPNQRNFITNIDELPQVIADYAIKSPAMIVIGDVVAMAGLGENIVNAALAELGELA